MIKGLIAKAAGLTLSGRAAWVGIGALVAALSWAAWSQYQIGRLHQQIGTCQGGVAAVADTATNNARELDACRSKLQDAIADQLLAREAEQAANRRLELETEWRRDLAERERLNRLEAYSDETCAVWAADLVCPPVADSLRSAAGGARGSGDGDADADTGADP